MTDDRGPFKLFQVGLEETVTKSIDIFVEAERREDIIGVNAASLSDDLDKYDWFDDSDGVHFCGPIEEVESVPANEEVYATILKGKILNPNSTDCRIIDEHIEEWRKEQKKLLNKPLPGQMGIPGVAEDIPK